MLPVCSACGRENPEGARFCNSCGAPLGAEHEPAREERKIVTVFFANLVGFTGRSEQLDPEDVRGMLSPYYARLRAEIERFGGAVEKFIGDAVMAVFGAPVAHEDDPERAVRASTDFSTGSGFESGASASVTTRCSIVTGSVWRRCPRRRRRRRARSPRPRRPRGGEEPQSVDPTRLACPP
jgi:class 3 adenylate cyclase